MDIILTYLRFSNTDRITNTTIFLFTPVFIPDYTCLHNQLTHNYIITVDISIRRRLKRNRNFAELRKNFIF